MALCPNLCYKIKYIMIKLSTENIIKKYKVEVLLEELNIKAIDLEEMKIKNIIFSLYNIDMLYITFNRSSIFYCYKCFENKPQNEIDVINFCSGENLQKFIQENDHDKKIELKFFTINALNEILDYLEILKNKTDKIQNKITTTEMFRLFHLALSMQRSNPEWREGQCLFNSLLHFHPKTAEKIRGTENDPFYKYANIVNFHKSILLE